MDTVVNKSDQEKFDEFFEKGCVEFTAFRNLTYNHNFKFGVYRLDINGISVELMFNMNLHRKQTYKKHNYAYPLVNNKFTSIKNKGISVSYSKFSKDEPLYTPKVFQVLVQHVEFVESVNEIMIKLRRQSEIHNLRLSFATYFEAILVYWEERENYKLTLANGNKTFLFENVYEIKNLFSNINRTMIYVLDFSSMFINSNYHDSTKISKINSLFAIFNKLKSQQENNSEIFEQVVNLFQYQFNKLK